MKVTVIPIVVVALRTIRKDLVKGLEELKIRGRAETIQTTALLKVGQNRVKISRDRRRIAVTQTPVKGD